MGQDEKMSVRERVGRERAAVDKGWEYFFPILWTTCARPTTLGKGMREPIRDRDISDELPPQTPIEKSRDIRQVSHCEWSLARRARAQSRCLHERARELIRTSEVLKEALYQQSCHQGQSS